MVSLSLYSSEPSETSADAPSRVANNRLWYVWVSAGAATLVGLAHLFLLFLTLLLRTTPASPADLAVVGSLTAITIACLGAAAGFLWHRTWATPLLLSACLLMLPRVGFSLYTLLAQMTAPAPAGLVHQIMPFLIVLAFDLYLAVLAWLTLAAMWRQSERFAQAILAVLALLVLVALALAPRLYL